MKFIWTACKFIWINLIWFKFMRSSFELHMNFIWTSYEFHMNKFDFISYEIHKKFILTSYEIHTKFTINSYVDQTNLMWTYAYKVPYELHMNEPPGPSYYTGISIQVLVARLLTWIRLGHLELSAWISNTIHSYMCVWNVITHKCSKINGA